MKVDKFVLKFIECEPFFCLVVFVVRDGDGEDDFMVNFENPRKISRAWFYVSGCSRLNYRQRSCAT